ncbi:MAG TPA: hypothetical protein VMO26_05210 [Vicinamibacterales bacterium]|nr:hypothetical protein [Vicinamibacterales bacterium]
MNTVDYTLSAVVGLLTCESLPYTSTVKVIGRDGGVIRVGDHKLDGLQSERSVALTLDYSHCSYSAPNRVAYTDEALNILEYPSSFDDRANEKVHAEIDHFSRYAVAY